MAPSGKGFRHRAGQFAFLQFDIPGHQEVHPFTISQAPRQDKCLRFTIKDLGDYTSELGRVMAVGTTAKVSGPFGHFKPARSSKQQIWIASGVGITPFLAWAQALADTAKPVDLFYCVRNRSLAPHLSELEQLANTKANLNLHLIESNVTGRLTIDQITAVGGNNLNQTLVAFCGPKDMRLSLKQQLVAGGLSPRNFRYEEFEIRSGIGLRRLAKSLVANGNGSTASARPT